MKGSFTLLLVLAVLFSTGCAEPLGRYYIKTDYEYKYHYRTNEYTLGNDYLTMRGYWRGGGSTRYLEDYVLNLSGVIAIWDGNNLVYPLTTEAMGFWGSVRGGTIPIHTSIPYWVPLIVIIGFFILFFRFAVFEIIKTLLRVFRLKPATLDPTQAPWIVKDINLPTDTQGIIATRDWKLVRHNVLMSANQGLVWEAANTKADERPSANNDKGLYAYRLGTNIQRSWAKLSGIVSLSGHCVGHTNGLIRAESCRILMLFCLWPHTAKELSARYGVPVMLTLDKRRSFEKWMVSHEGIRWLKHNADLTDGGMLLDREIDAIIEREEF